MPALELYWRAHLERLQRMLDWNAIRHLDFPTPDLSEEDLT